MSNIVVIDDEEYILSILSEILAIDGHQIAEFQNGWDAIDFIKENKVDLIVSDIEMPEIKGFEILEIVKSDLKTAAIPFIFLTALDKEYQIREGMTLGADDYITKPFETNVLLKSVKSRLEKSQKIDSFIEKKLDELRLNLSSVLPHELLTPLNGIIGPIQMLMDNLDSFTKEEIQELHKVIYFCAKRLKSITSNFIFYLELEKRKKSTNVGKIENTKEIIESLATNLAEEKNREKDLIIKLKDYPLKINYEDFKKIFIEIIGNAFKFSSTGSKVEIVSKETDDKITYEITDHGKGMTDFQIAEIEAYKQFNRKEFEQQGLGLGLHICKKIASLYDLDFQIQSQKNNFTTINLGFPKI